jgi:Dolichyl-phosphate-mannose-protein mannosyltransferase
MRAARTLLIDWVRLGFPHRLENWRRRPVAERIWDGLSLALLIVVASLVIATFRDYGVTWDENLNNWYGKLALNYYLSFFADQRALHFQDLINYGAVFDMAAAALNRFSPLGVYETRHLLNALVGVLGLFGTWKLGRALGGPRAGFAAALLLALTPIYYGQMFNNPKDIPFAVGGIWTLYYLVRIVPTLPRPPLRLVVKLGIAAGMTMAVRVGGLLFLCYLGLLLTLSGLWQAAVARRLTVLATAGWQSLVRAFLPASVLAYALMLVFWPWAQSDPIGHPLAALATFSHQVFPYDTLFDGRFVPAWNLPWTYLPVYTLIVLPELVLVLLIAAPVLAAVALWRDAATRRRETVLSWFLVGFAIVFPVAYAIAIKAVLFDGMRHFIFVLPPIAVVAGLAADAALVRLAGFRLRRPIYGALVLYGAAHVAIMVMLHPDQYVYYNAFVGGVDGAERRFKLDYWANSYAEDVRGLERVLRAQYGAGFAAHRFTVAVCGPATAAQYYFPANFRLTYKAKTADFFIAFTKDNCDRSLPGHPVYEVKRMGALLSVVLDRREILAERARDIRPVAGAVQKPSEAAAVP